MAKSSRARKKSRNNSVPPTRIDSTAGVVLPADEVEAKAASADSIPEPAEEEAETAAPKCEPQIAAAEKPPVSADVSGEFKGFFAKPEEEIHLEEMRREAPDLHEEAVVAPRRRVDRRAHQFVAVVVGLFAAIGIAGAVMRKAEPRAAAATAVAAAQPIPPPPVAAPPPPPPAAAEPAPPPPAPPAPVETAAAAPAPAPAPTETAAAPAATTVAVAAAAPPPADDEESLSGPQLLSKARQAINSGAASKAAAYAKKAIAKGAGGSAYYVLGAAYQTMGSNGAAKGAYGNCAKSGCAEAGECASLAESL